MGKMIRAKLNDGSICCMAKKAFYLFLEQDKVIEFERSDGWVAVNEVPERDKSGITNYNGTERRQI